MFTLGNSIITLVNMVTMIGPYLADWKCVDDCVLLQTIPSNNVSCSETHIYNPKWPPHARYHNGQTMTMGLFIGLITFFTLYAIIPRSSSPQTQTIHLTWIVLLQSLIYLSSLSGILYPGAAWEDPEFGSRSPQLYAFPVLVGLCWLGWYIETRRFARVTDRKHI